MPQNQELYFDRVLSMYSKKVELDDKLVLAATVSSIVHPDNNLQIKVNSTEQSFRRYYRKKLVETLRGSNLVLIEDTVIDDLVELPPETTKYEEAIQHMPFPVIFFELDKTLDIEILSGKRIALRGILFGHGRNASPTSKMMIETCNEDINVYYMGLFYEGINDKSLPVDIHIDPHDLLIKSTTTVTAIDPFDPLGNKNKQFCVDINPDGTQKVNLEYTQKVISLCANLINYINAHNITINQIERQTTQEYERINRKRESKGKSKLEPLRPYHIIVVEQSFISDKVNEEIDGTGRKMDYREMVRGHFQRYHKREGVIRYWIPRYVRGPEDAPWKENRYRVRNNL